MSQGNLDSALTSIVDVLTDGERNVFTRPVPPVPLSDAEKDALGRRGRIARQQLYLQGMPVMDPGRVRDLEDQMPKVLELVKSLRRRPSLRRQLQHQIRDVVTAAKSANEGLEGEERLRVLTHVLGQDLQVVDEDGERLVITVGLAGLALASFMAGYTIAYNWNR